MFRYIFRLQAQDFTLAAIPAAVKQDIYLLHEISPEFVRIRVSRIHEFVDAGQFNFVILFQLDIENGPRHIGGVVERRRREVCTVCCSFCSTTGAVVAVAAFAALISLAFTPFCKCEFAIILNTPFTEGLKLFCIPCPSVCRSSGLSLSTLQRFDFSHPKHGE